MKICLISFQNIILFKINKIMLVVLYPIFLPTCNKSQWLFRLVFQSIRESRMPHIVHNFVIFNSYISKISVAKGSGRILICNVNTNRIRHTQEIVNGKF